MPTIRIDVPEIMETKVYTLEKGAAGRTETAQVVQHKPAAWHATVLDAIWLKGVQRYANDYFASEKDPVAKASKVKVMVAAFNDGQTLADVTGKAARTTAAKADPATVIARSLARKIIKAEMPAAEYKAAYTDADAADQLKAIDAWLEADPRGEKVRKLAAKRAAEDAELASIA